jgi:FkbM family methyltransferase
VSLPSIKRLYRALVPTRARDVVRDVLIHPSQKARVLVAREISRRLPCSVEPHIQAILRTHLGSGATYVDVGANYGGLASLALELVAPAGAVVCFEPVPSNFARLLRTVSRRMNERTQLVLEQRAIGDVPGRIDIYLNFWDGQHTTEPDVNRSEQVGVLSVGQVTLDDALGYHGISEVTVLKIDVEGAEFRALAGAAKLLAGQRIAAIILEICDPEEPGKADNAEKITRFLEDFGYFGQLVTTTGLSAWDAQTCTSRQDVLFLRRDQEKLRSAPRA